MSFFLQAFCLIAAVLWAQGVMHSSWTLVLISMSVLAAGCVMFKDKHYDGIAVLGMFGGALVGGSIFPFNFEALMYGLAVLVIGLSYIVVQVRRIDAKIKKLKELTEAARQETEDLVKRLNDALSR